MIQRRLTLEKYPTLKNRFEIGFLRRRAAAMSAAHKRIVKVSTFSLSKLRYIICFFPKYVDDELFPQM
jgi:hypothetical protein